MNTNNNIIKKDILSLENGNVYIRMDNISIHLV